MDAHPKKEAPLQYEAFYRQKKKKEKSPEEKSLLQQKECRQIDRQTVTFLTSSQKWMSDNWN